MTERSVSPTSTPPLLSRFDANELAFLAARLFLTLALGVLYLADIMAGAPQFEHWLYLGALALATIDYVVLFVSIQFMGVSVSKAMVAIIVPEMIGLATFSYLGKPDDAFYPAVLVFPIFYALIVDRFTANFVGGAAAISYAVGLLLVGPRPIGIGLLYAFKILTIPVVTWLITNAVGVQRDREKAAEKVAAHTEELNERLRRRMREMEAVADVTELIHSSLEFDAVGPQVLDILASVTGVDTCCLFVIDKERNETVFSASRGGTISGADEGVLPAFAEMENEHLTCMPVFDHAPMIVLFCGPSEQVERLSDEQRIVLAAMASELTVAVENSQLYKLTATLAITDELTGLANYRHLQQRLDEEIARSNRYGKSLSLLMLDADDFKAFNDAHGHVAGDRALAELGPIMRRGVREVDLVARYGGEEFSVVLPETDATGAYIVAEKIREAVDNHRFADAEGRRVCGLTVSVGFASYPAHGADKDAILREADDALYHAKSGGKNRVRGPRALWKNSEADQGPAEDEWTGV